MALRRTCKSKKKAWRGADMQDVENFMENSRLEERIGNVAAKEDKELFAVDTTAEGDATTAEGDAKPTPVKKVKRKLNALKPPRCFSGLENSSKVPDPLSNRSKIRQKKNVTKLKHPSLLSNLPARKEGTDERQACYKDLWDEAQPVLDREKKKQALTNGWFTEQLVDHHLKNTGINIRRVPGTARKKTTLLKAIELPHPGISYNPSLDAHSSLLRNVIKRESKIIEEEEHLDRVVGAILKKVPARDHDCQYLQEMSAGLPLALNDDDSVDECGAEYSTLNKPVEVKKKGRVTRRKQREERERELIREQAKQVRKVVTDIDRVNRIKTEVVKKEMKLANRRNKECQLEKEKPYNALRLARLKYAEPDEDLVMPSDLADSLRTMRPQGSILKDRFSSLQKRNILAPNKAQGVRKRHKVKSYIRNTHKGFLEKPINQPRKTVNKMRK